MVCRPDSRSIEGYALGESAKRTGHRRDCPRWLSWIELTRYSQAAIELDPGKRAAFLDTSCAGDEELRSEVESLFSCDEQGLSFVDEPAFQVAAGLLMSDEPELAEGQHIGPMKSTA